MSRILTVVLALVVLAIFQAAVAALVLALAIMLLFYLATRPRETLIFLGTLLVFGLASARPLAFIFTAGIVALTVVVVGARRRSARERQTTGDQSDGQEKSGSLDRNLLD